MRDEEKSLKIALASGLPADIKKAIALGDKYVEYEEARRYLFYLESKGLLDKETLNIALENVKEYFSIHGLGTYQDRLSDDELSILGALSNVKGYDTINERPLFKPPDERINNVKELMQDARHRGNNKKDSH